MGFRKKILRKSPPEPLGASFQTEDPSNVGEVAAQLSLNLSTPRTPQNFPPEFQTSSNTLTPPTPKNSHDPPLWRSHSNKQREIGYDFSTCITRENSVLPPYKYFLPDVLAAIKHTEGNLHEISLLLNRTRTSVRDYIFANIETQAALEEQKEILLDHVEKKLFSTALELGDPATLRFICSTLARNRGYTPEVKVGNSSEGPLQFELVLQKEQFVLPSKDLTNDEKKIDNFLRGKDES